MTANLQCNPSPQNLRQEFIQRVVTVNSDKHLVLIGLAINYSNSLDSVRHRIRYSNESIEVRSLEQFENELVTRIKIIDKITDPTVRHVEQTDPPLEHWSWDDKLRVGMGLHLNDEYVEANSYIEDFLAASPNRL